MGGKPLVRIKLSLFSILAAAACGSTQNAAAPCTFGASPASKSPVDPTGEWEIRWDRGFSGWQPAIFNGTLEIRRDKGALAASLKFNESVARPEFSSMSVDGEKVDIVFHTPAKSGGGEMELRITGWIHDGRLVGEARWGDSVPWTPCGGRRMGDALKPDPALIINGVVLNPDGTPASEADVVVVAGDMRGDEQTNTAGHFAVTAPAAGEALLYAYKNGRSARLQGAFSPTKSVTLSLVEPGAIEGTFSSASASTKVFAWLGPGKIPAVLPGIWGVQPTIDGNHFKFESVPAGDLEVHLAVGEGPGLTAHALVHVDPSKTATVSLDPKPATASVAGTARNPTSHEALRSEAFLLMPDGSPEAWYPIAGYFEFGSRTPGDRVVLLVAHGYKPRRMPVTLEANQKKDLGDIVLEPATGSH
jgi:hypothetical protein